MNSRLPQLRTVVISRFCICLVEYKFFNENSNKPLPTMKGVVFSYLNYLLSAIFATKVVLIRYTYGLSEIRSFTILYTISLITPILISYLSTYDLYSPVRNGFDAGRIYYEGKWEGLSPGNRDFFCPVKWDQAERRVLFVAQNSRDFQGPTPSHLPK
jgi:hypothetical protein